jgi:predicted RNase H-like HicB family nuclease
MDLIFKLLTSNYKLCCAGEHYLTNNVTKKGEERSRCLTFKPKRSKMKLVAIVQPTYQGLTKRFSAYSPDIPGCIANGSTEKKAIEALRVMITHQINRLEEVGMEPPQSSCKIEILTIETKKSQESGDEFVSLSRLQ